MEIYKCGFVEVIGWLVFFSLLMVFVLVVLKIVFDVDFKDFILFIGVVGIWCYFMGGVYFLCGMLFFYVVYLYYCWCVCQLGSVVDLLYVFLMVISFCIDVLIIVMVYCLVICEVIDSGYLIIVVCFIVEMFDEVLVCFLWEKMNLLDWVSFDFVWIFGIGKCDGLVYGFCVIFWYLLDDDVVVVVIDGDIVFDYGVVKKIVFWFKFFFNVGGFIINEFCEVQGGYVMSEWYKLCFVQCYINMCLMVLFKCVLIMIGWMLVFCVWVVINFEFIIDVENDYLEYWCLGCFKFFIGDDKFSWFSLMCLGYDIFYVFDVVINMVEYLLEKSFIKVSCKLMYCWYGNNLWQNLCVFKFGVWCLGWFIMLVLFDQCVLMWISLFGLVVVIFVSFKYSIVFLLVYLFWIGFICLVLILFFLFFGYCIGLVYLLIFYYNQIVGVLVKIYVFFCFDWQFWICQLIKLECGLVSFQCWFNVWLLWVMIFFVVSIFVVVLLIIV